MTRIQMLNKQRAQALSGLINAVKSGSNSNINKALLFYRIPCYSPNDTGKSDSDVQYDIRKVNQMIEKRKSSSMGAALMKNRKHYLYTVVSYLENVLYLRDHYRKGLVMVDDAYTVRSRVSIVESEPVTDALPIAIQELTA